MTSNLKFLLEAGVSNRCQNGMVSIFARYYDGMILSLGRCQYGLFLIIVRCQDGLILILVRLPFNFDQYKNSVTDEEESSERSGDESFYLTKLVDNYPCLWE